MAAAPSSGLSVAPIGEITSHPPKVIASDHLTNRDATEIPARAEAEGISKKSLWTAKKALGARSNQTRQCLPTPTPIAHVGASQVRVALGLGVPPYLQQRADELIERGPQRVLPA
jgi:hypothetical protein